VLLILGSASPARRAVLRAAGVEPVVHVSHVDEDAVAAALPDPTPERVVSALAVAKAEAVLGAVGAQYPDAVLVGCDSMLSVVGPNGPELVGKPGTAELARQRWSVLAGNSGELLTGHCVLRLTEGRETARAVGVGVTTVRFGTPTPAELDAYLASGEPLQVAGAFTLDGRGGWFVEGVDGDPSSVIGISLPLTRRLLADVGVDIAELWRNPAERSTVEIDQQ
jgi:septum formation protein